jgi:hypothetical protein
MDDSAPGTRRGYAMALVHRLGWDARFCERSPWFWPLRAAAEPLRALSDWPSLAELEALYQRATVGQELPPLRFRENVRKQERKRDGRVVLEALYDARVDAGEVPTRERDWHDLFNALCFATFPRSKRALHARQLRALTARIVPDAKRLPPTRSPEQDTLTLFDEGGVALAAEPGAAQQLMAAEGNARSALWSALIEARRARPVPFGHALFEHLVEGLRCPGGCTQIVELDDVWGPEPAVLQRLDVALARALADPERFCSTRECSHVQLELLTRIGCR